MSSFTTFRPHPLRIQRKRTKGFRLPEGTICVTRPGIFGNPFKTAADFARWLNTADVPADFSGSAEDLLGQRLTILLNLHMLAGKNLACFCPLDRYCHADVLAYRASKLLHRQ